MRRRKIVEAARTWLVILANLSAVTSPLTTLSLKPGLFTSFRLTYKDRSFDLYWAVVPPKSLYTATSIPFARLRMRSVAVNVHSSDIEHKQEELSIYERQNQPIVHRIGSPSTGPSSCRR